MSVASNKETTIDEARVDEERYGSPSGGQVIAPPAPGPARFTLGPSDGYPTGADEAISCPRCHERNPHGSVYCWRCFTPLSAAQRPLAVPVGGGTASVAPSAGPGGWTPPPPAPPAPGMATGSYSLGFGQPPPGLGAPPPSWGRIGVPIGESTAAPKKFGLVPKIVALVAVVAVLIGGAAYYFKSGSGTTLHIPEQIAGAQHITGNGQLDQAVQQMEAAGQSLGATGYAAYYGTGGIPTFFFAAYDYRRHSGESTDQLFQQFAEGFAGSSNQMALDTIHKVADNDGASDYICVPVRGSIRSSLCMWQDDGSVGFVMAMNQNVSSTRLLASSVRTTVEG